LDVVSESLDRIVKSTVDALRAVSLSGEKKAVGAGFGKPRGCEMDVTDTSARRPKRRQRPVIQTEKTTHAQVSRL